jgi:F420-dependent oxidoreductase-like protein
MRVSIFIEPHRGASYDDQLRFARRTEECGYEGLLRADHYLAMSPEQPLPGPSDAWLTLAGLARETSRIRIGTLVSSATFRPPGPLAIMAAQVDQMSGGRLDLGIGTGWYEREHTAYGIDFPPLKERFDRLAEQLAIITGLWSTLPGTGFSYHGRHYRLQDAPGLPKPVQIPGPPIIIGGRGTSRTPELAARYADEFNMPFRSVAETAEAYRRVAEASDRIGRSAHARPLVRSAGIVVAIGRTDAETQRRARPLYERSALPPECPVVGSPAELVQRIGEFAEIGTDRVHLRLIDLTDLDHLELIAAEVLPQLPRAAPAPAAG